MKKLAACLLVGVILVALFPSVALADMGPKPSVVVNFDGLAGQTYYVTLLSSVQSTGPHSAYTEGEYSHYNKTHKDYAVYKKFVDYQDADGYYFLQFFQDCSETHQFKWTYYSPSNFKVLIYFPDIDVFAVSSGTYEKYAFDSHFTVSLTDTAQSFAVTNSYDYRGETISLAVRIALTIIIELLIALLFAFRHKKQLLFIVAVNLATQIALNIALNFINYNYGQMMFVFSYILLETLIFAVEAVLFTVILWRLSGTLIPRWKTVAYSWVANTISFVLGIILANILPGIF